MFEAGGFFFPNAVVRLAEAVRLNIREDPVGGPSDIGPQISQEFRVCRKSVVPVHSIDEGADRIVLRFDKGYVAAVPHIVSSLPGAVTSLATRKPA